MGELQPGGGAVTIYSFLNHVFFATFDEKAVHMASPEQYVILSSIEQYIFSPRPGEREPPVFRESSNPRVKLLNKGTLACAAKFRSMVPGIVHMWFEDGGAGSFQGALNLGKESTINTYEGHVFYFTDVKRTVEYARFDMKRDLVLYVVRDALSPPPQHLIDHEKREEAFSAEYLARTGRQWRHYFGPDGPRNPPSLFMWPAPEMGHRFTAVSTQGYWTCRGPSSMCQSLEPVEMKLEVISLAPRVFLIENFLSDFECEEIKNIAEPKMSSSTVGNQDAGGAREDSTRTSRNAWVGRKASVVTDSLFGRAEHLLKIERLDNRNTEDMQVVHYKIGQKYDSHHDWGVSGYPESRFVTLLLYLSDMEDADAGGETSFPKGANGLGFKAHAGKGNAILFYNLLEDGNGDDLALHAALPLRKGEKWLSNFWVWDPVRR
ncbi:hypothetical protein B484DRAFT_405765 [Ochromonadaceae sp. CCMP2298]|nr:hypothetical protein B484DRAFT_405765 [Ochromonadaceae sp. CCMP2298]